MRAGWFPVALGFAALLMVSPAIGAPSVRFADVVQMAGSSLARFEGHHLDRLALFACSYASGAGDKCHPIPFQIDECDAEGRWVLDQGPQPNADEPPGVLDGNDLFLFMATDAGDRAARADLPGGPPAAEVSVHDPLTGSTRWVYLLAFTDAAPRAPQSYVRYDPAADRVHGAHVSLGFRHGVPGYLAVASHASGAAPADAANLLDRFKVRATATFLWGLIRFSRNEDDVGTEFMGWHQGPIRVIRRQRQWVRIGWGIRSPTFGSYTYFYRDFAELPVGLRLSFPPTYFFGNIAIRAILDFRDLKGWSLLVPTLPAPVAIDGTMTAQKAALNDLPASWFALVGPQITLVQTMEVSPSLSSVRRRLLYRENGATPEPPEEVPGEAPGIGYQLDHWEHVAAGAHQLAAVSYALAADVDVRQFMAARAAPLQVRVQALQ